ncbi:MAG: DUF5012 domain-containing protein [Bacteroidales bacterium]|nr:DUF5012 domain-containing protein [Bacteroidales bacterium]MCI5618395.1 DUF5012 domain-containing protein [Rikenellaceae bacterium]
MKKIIYFAIGAVVAMTLAASCTKESEGLTRITYYPVLELEGETTMLVDKGSSFNEPGYTATLNGEDVSADVKIESNVNTSKSGIYSVVYSIVNSDGFSSVAKRTVIVFDFEDPVEGIYTVDPSSYRLYNGAQLAFGRAFQIYVLANGDGTYLVDDILGGWYCQRAGYGTDYAMQATISISGGSVNLINSYIPGWGDSLVDWADGSFADGTLSYTAVYVSGMEFHITMSK